MNDLTIELYGELYVDVQTLKATTEMLLEAVKGLAAEVAELKKQIAELQS